MIQLWPCSNDLCRQPCTSLVLDGDGLCPSCSFSRFLDGLPRLELPPQIDAQAETPPAKLQRQILTTNIIAGLIAGALFVLAVTWSFQP